MNAHCYLIVFTGTDIISKIYAELNEPYGSFGKVGIGKWEELSKTDFNQMLSMFVFSGGDITQK